MATEYSRIGRSVILQAKCDDRLCQNLDSYEVTIHSTGCREARNLARAAGWAIWQDRKGVEWATCAPCTERSRERAAHG